MGDNLNCSMCGKEVDREIERSMSFHDACEAKCSARFHAKECVYCGEKIDDDTISSDHCPDRKYVGFD